MNQNKKQFALKWPWNIVAGVVAAIVLGLFIGFLWSTLLVVGIFAWQRKNNPGMPQDGYCMARTRSRLKWLPLGLLFAVLGGMLLAFYLYSAATERAVGSDDKRVALIGGPLLVVVGLGICWFSIRESFFPEKGSLAQSIRSQLPYPEEAPPVKELFAQVDQDLQKNGQTFGRVIIGKEWVLGDEASYIPQIRAVFSRDEMVTHARGNGGMRSTRMVELYIVDDRNQQQFTDVRNPRELPMILECLRLRAPDAYFGDYQELAAYQNVSDQEQELREQDFQHRQGEKQAQQASRVKQPQQRVVLMAQDIAPTSLVDAQTLDALLHSTNPAKGFVLVAGVPVKWQTTQYDTLRYDPNQKGGRFLLEERATEAQTGSLRRALQLEAIDQEQAMRILLAWMEGTIWQPERWTQSKIRHDAIELNGGSNPVPQQTSRPKELHLVTMAGVSQVYDNFTREDVQVAAEGIVDLTYQLVRYIKAGGWNLMTVENGTKQDGRCTVTVSRLMQNELCFYQCKTQHRKAAQWMLEFYDETFAPDWREWKDVTRKLTK